MLTLIEMFRNLGRHDAHVTSLWCVLLQVGEVIYSTPVEIEVVHAEEMGKSSHVVLRLKFDNTPYFKSLKDPGRKQMIKNLEVGDFTGCLKCDFRYCASNIRWYLNNEI